MPTTRSFTSSYSGEAIRSYILKSLIGGETLSTNGISIRTGVKYKEVIKKLSSSGVVQEGGCDFTPAGTITITENVLEPKKIKINEQICFEDVYQLWDSENMADGMNNEEMPAELVDAVLGEFTNQSAKEIEEAIWQGDATGSTGTIKDLFDGYIKQLGDSGDTVDVIGVTLTDSNIVTELNKVYTALPAGVRKKGAAGLVYFVSYKTAALYRQNLAAQGDNDTANEPVLRFYGIELRETGGMPDDAIVFGARDNFYFATDLLSDWSEIRMLDQREVDGSDYINFVLKAKADVKIGFFAEVVLYN